VIYLLDTNIVSYLIKGDRAACARLVAVPIHNVVVSVVTEAELLFGVAKRGNPVELQAKVSAFLERAAVLPWTSPVAQTYASLRANMERKGMLLAPLDMMIGAHALSVGAILVTRDQAFGQIPELQVERWT
jgi:tRNA(fMet)-specific endonuclease VapC